MWEAAGEGEAASSLREVIVQYKEHIEGTTKGPIVQRSSESDLSNFMEKDEQKVWTFQPLKHALYGRTPLFQPLHSELPLY